MKSKINLKRKTHHYSGFIAGKRSTSLILFESDISIVNLSIPIPQPPVGGRPYSRDVTKF
jgi:hypothetical protein